MNRSFLVCLLLGICLAVAVLRFTYLRDQKSAETQARDSASASEHSLAMALTEANFEREVTQHKGVMIVDFWAPWCAPCRMMSPILEQFAEENKDKIAIAKVDADESPELRKQFVTEGIPLFVIFKDGKKVDSRVGTMTKDELAKWAGGYLK